MHFRRPCGCSGLPEVGEGTKPFYFFMDEGESYHFLGACVRVCVRVSVYASVRVCVRALSLSRRTLKTSFSLIDNVDKISAAGK